MINKFICIGNIGNDPEIINTQKTNICNFNIAINKKNKNNTYTVWLPVKCFNNTADFVYKYIKKGDTVYIEGEIRVDKWETKDKIKKMNVYVVPDKVKTLKRSNSGQAKEELDLPY